MQKPSYSYRVLYEETFYNKYKNKKNTKIKKTASLITVPIPFKK